MRAKFGVDPELIPDYLALVGDTFRNVPTAIEIEPNSIEELWLQHSRLENISGPAIVISAEKSRLTEINVEDTVAKGIAVFAKLREIRKARERKDDAAVQIWLARMKELTGKLNEVG